jgi:hypothetical protein
LDFKFVRGQLTNRHIQAVNDMLPKMPESASLTPRSWKGLFIAMIADETSAP